MRHSVIALGATIAAVALGATFVIAQDAPTSDQAGRRAAVQGQMRQWPGPGPWGPGAGPGARQGMRGRRGAGPLAFGGGGRGRGLAALKLTDEQRAKVTDLARAVRDQAAPLRDELALTRKELHREVFADARNASKVAELSAKAAALERQLAELHLKHTTDLADALTVEQRETMRLRGGPGNGPGRGPGGPAGGGRGRGR